MRIAYADPPYPGMSHFYKDHPDYGGEVDHADLIAKLQIEFDGFVLHTASTTLAQVLPHCGGARVMAWVKSFASFKKNVMPAYAWEPVIIDAARKPVHNRRQVMRDWVECPMTMRKGLTGAKPEKVCHWAFEMVGAHPDDELVDMFPGTGAVTKAWESWRKLFTLP